jgi:hypothetical protein
MKTLPGRLLATALALAAATNASAYHFSPPDVSAHLHGKLTFTPNEGANPQPFTCLITFDLKTKIPSIKAVKFIKGDCVGVTFQDMPFLVDITGANSGVFGGGGFTSSFGNCVGEETQFQDNKSGIWTLPAGQCISGTLTSNPPTTIVK